MRIIGLLFLPLVQGIVKCISIYGCETNLKNFVCSWVHPVEYYLEKLSLLGFNTIRVPFALQYIEENDFTHLDHFIQQSYIYNMNVILDMHRIFFDKQDFSPFDRVTKERFISGWLFILERYYNFPNVYACNVYNEYQGSDIQFLTQYSKDVLFAIEDRFPNRYTYYLTGYNWSGSVQNFSLEDMPFRDRINYSVHKYWFSGTQDPNNFDYESDWDLSFGNNTDKLVIGEWGFKNRPEEIAWAKRFISYLKLRKIQNTCFWTIAYSSDTDGLWYDDCETLDWEKFIILQSLWNVDRKYLRNI